MLSVLLTWVLNRRKDLLTLYVRSQLDMITSSPVLFHTPWVGMVNVTRFYILTMFWNTCMLLNEFWIIFTKIQCSPWILLSYFQTITEHDWIYSIFSGAPTGEYLKENQEFWTFHGIFLPPLLRSATVKKHMVGYELLAQAQRDLTAEQAALKLRSLPTVHYKQV